MSEYCSLFDSEISSGLGLWNDVTLGSPSSRLLRMNSDGTGAVESSLSPTESISTSSFWCQAGLIDAYGSFPDSIFDSVISPSNSDIQEEEYLDHVMSLDGFLHSDSCEGLEGLEITELTDFSCPPKMRNDTCEPVDQNNYENFSDTDDQDENFDKQSQKSSSSSSTISVSSTKNSREVCDKGSVASRNIALELPRRSTNFRRAVRNSSINNNSKKTPTNVRTFVSKSDDEDDVIYQHQSARIGSTRKRSCNIVHDDNKNAVQARINREKKKAYISNLEQQVVDLKSENDSMRNESESARCHAASLADEVAYLKAVLANQSALASLLKNINGDATMPVMMSSAFSDVHAHSADSKKRPYIEEHDYAQSQRSAKRANVASTKKEAVAAGVCLHVNRDRVTLEMCRHCSVNSDRRST